MIKNYKGYLLALLIISGIFIAAAPFAVKYWVGNYSGAEVTASEATAIAEWGDAADGLTSTQADKLFELSATAVSLAELNTLDASVVFGSTPLYWEYSENFIGVALDSAYGARTAVTNALAQVSTNASLQGWNGTGDAGWALTSAAGTLGGIVALTPVTASNNEVYTQLGELGTETFIEYTGSSGKESWVEFEIATDDITSSAANFFVGLAEEGSAAADFINDSGADIADKDVLGFVSWETTMDSIRLIYQTSGGTFAVGTGVALSTAFQTLGIYFDGATTITWYVDGVSIGSVATTASLVPDTEELSPIIGIKNGAQDRILSLKRISMKVEN